MTSFSALANWRPSMLTIIIHRPTNKSMFMLVDLERDTIVPTHLANSFIPTTWFTDTEISSGGAGRIASYSLSGGTGAGMG